MGTRLNSIHRSQKPKKVQFGPKRSAPHVVLKLGVQHQQSIAQTGPALVALSCGNFYWWLFSSLLFLSTNSKISPSFLSSSASSASTSPHLGGFFSGELSPSFSCESDLPFWSPPSNPPPLFPPAPSSKSATCFPKFPSPEAHSSSIPPSDLRPLLSFFPSPLTLWGFLSVIDCHSD